MKKNCWQRRTKLEITLICAVIIATGVIITLSILQLHFQENAFSDFAQTSVVLDEHCDSQICIKESLQILSRIDNSIDPCEDFYLFSCNNVPTGVQVNKRHGPFTNIIEDAELKLEYMYSESIKDSDHNIVKIQKKLFQACRNETAIEIDTFRTVQATLKAVGGWPVVEGPTWNESGFDWRETTYKLRQLGYTYASYLDVNIVTDPPNQEKYIFEVAIPEVKDIYSKFFDSDERNGFMTDVAVVFGAEIHHAIAEMTETLDFLLDLQWKRYAIENEERSYRTTVSHVQQKHGTIDWLEFINRIVGRTARISENDYILFPSERAIDEWFNSLFKASKRLQANYIMWRVVEEALPYLTQILLKGKVKPRLILDAEEDRETRTEYCITEVRKRFAPSPIDILYLRKYLPQDKRDDVEELIGNLQAELVEVVRQIDWMSIEDKIDAEERINEVKVIIGAPGDYFDDEILNDMSYNFNKSYGNNFLKLISEANRNRKNHLYNLIHKPTRNTRLVWWKMYSHIPIYDPETNELEIPPGILQEEIFNENRPNYLNYGIMGITMKNFLLGYLESSSGWSNRTTEAFLRRLQCLTNDSNPHQIDIPKYLIYQPLSHVLGWRVSYAAYKNWLVENGEELPLFAVDFTPRQLFWISSGYIFCHYTNPLFDDDLYNGTIKTAYVSIVKEFINNHVYLSRDFSCSNLKLDYKNKCQIF